MMTRARRRVRIVAVNVGLGVLLLGLVEAGLLLLLAGAPAWLGSGRLLALAREWYLRQRQIVQYLDACAEAEPRLGYRLRPGRCTFTNTEFSTVLEVNRLGLRDDEGSLVGPEIIVLGDSHAMGWGVAQDETFAQKLETRTSRRVLNAAVSSYGTVRELALLETLDTTRLRTVVIQYSANDIAENDFAHWHAGAIDVMSAAGHRRLVAEHAAARRYYPGELLATLTRSRLLDPAVAWAARWRAGLPPPAPTPEAEPRWEAGLFLDVLARSRVDLTVARVVVLEINSRAEHDATFVDAVDALVTSDPAYASLAHLATLDLTGDLAPDHYYRLDDHMRASGHAVVAGALIDLVIE